mmetsp:Transcript_17134/g.37249  ORF Transcript_17134/g.37249 Transcript_17134/m.37249 type:complete len:375 (+) Transcript_17134:81-1205(+)
MFTKSKSLYLSPTRPNTYAAMTDVTKCLLLAKQTLENVHGVLVNEGLVELVHQGLEALVVPEVGQVGVAADEFVVFETRLQASLQRLNTRVHLVDLGVAAGDVVLRHLEDVGHGGEVVAHVLGGLEAHHVLEDHQRLVVLLLLEESEGLVEHSLALRLPLLLGLVVLLLHLLRAQTVVAPSALRLEAVVLLVLEAGQVASTLLQDHGDVAAASLHGVHHLTVVLSRPHLRTERSADLHDLVTHLELRVGGVVGHLDDVRTTVVSTRELSHDRLGEVNLVGSTDRGVHLSGSHSHRHGRRATGHRELLVLEGTLRERNALEALASRDGHHASVRRGHGDRSIHLRTDGEGGGLGRDASHCSVCCYKGKLVTGWRW